VWAYVVVVLFLVSSLKSAEIRLRSTQSAVISEMISEKIVVETIVFEHGGVSSTADRCRQGPHTASVINQRPPSTSTKDEASTSIVKNVAFVSVNSRPL